MGLTYHPKTGPNRNSRPCNFFRCTWHIVRPANPPGSSDISVASNGLIKLQVIKDRLLLGNLLQCHFRFSNRFSSTRLEYSQSFISQKIVSATKKIQFG